jgi:tetratricopeptide (TPR) repeat protein
LLVLLAPSVRAGEDRAATAQAQAHFERGLKHYRLGEFLDAAEEYKASYSAKANPELLYNIAQAYRLGNDLDKALFFYRSYLSALPEATNRGEVEQRITKLEASIAEQKKAAAPAEKQEKVEPPPTTAPVVTPAPAPPNVLTATAPPPPAHTPVYKKWWLWTIVGVAAAGAATGIALGVTMSDRTRGTAFEPVSLP